MSKGMMVHDGRYSDTNAEDLGGVKEEMLEVLNRALEKRTANLGIDVLADVLKTKITTIGGSSPQEFAEDTANLISALGKVIIDFIVDNENLQDKRLTRYELKSSLDWIVKHFSLIG